MPPVHRGFLRKSITLALAILGLNSFGFLHPVARAASKEKEVLPTDVDFALILPGFLGSCGDFESLAEEMRASGYPAAVCPIEWWHWIPCVGGRSMRPILDRIDHALDQLDGMPRTVKAPEYSLLDFFQDFMSNPGGIFKVGGSDEPSEYPLVASRWESQRPRRRVALVAHSAAGWISRLYLSSVPYSGTSFNGSSKVHSLVCLGSPHFVADNLVFKSLRYLEARGGTGLPAQVRCLCVGANGTMSLASDMTRGAYELCGAKPGNEVDGDGMTPLFSALAFEAAETMVVQNVSHAPVYPAFGPSAELAAERQSKPWYGSPEILQQWLPWLQKST